MFHERCPGLLDEGVTIPAYCNHCQQSQPASDPQVHVAPNKEDEHFGRFVS